LGYLQFLKDFEVDLFVNLLIAYCFLAILVKSLIL